MENIIQIIIALASCITATTAYILWKQLKILNKQLDLLREQIKIDYEKLKREKAVNLLIEWSKFLRQKTSLARKLAEQLDDKQSRELFKQEPFKINKKLFKLAEAFFDIKNDKKDDEYELNEDQVARLRWEVISFLNFLESILTAWRHNIVDRNIIMEEFQYLINPEEGYYILEKVRKAAGGRKVYPAIDDFVEKLKEIKEGKTPGKGPIVKNS